MKIAAPQSIQLLKALYAVTRYHLGDKDQCEVWLHGDMSNFRLFASGHLVQIICLKEVEWQGLEEGEVATFPVPCFYVVENNGVVIWRESLTGHACSSEGDPDVRFEQPVPIEQVNAAMEKDPIAIDNQEILKLISEIALSQPFGEPAD